MSRDAAGVGRARKLWEAVRDGMTIFFNTGAGWDVIGPAHLITPGAEVTVTKADGATTRVIVRQVMAERTIDGVATRTATFGPAPAPAPAPAPEPAPALELESPRPVYHVRDRQAATVGGMLGQTGSTLIGYCHYCGLPLDRNGDCDECR
jgi:hypothetical protein